MVNTKKVSYLETHYNFLLSNYAQSDPRGAIYNPKINYLPRVGCCAVLCYALWTWNQIKVIYYITGWLLMGGQCYNGATRHWALKDCFWRDFSFPSGNKININPDW